MTARFGINLDGKPAPEITWNATTRSRYWEMLEVLPPRVMLADGFLVGEPMDHATCSVTGNVMPRYEAFLEHHDDYYVGSRPMTISEFRKAERPWRRA